MKSDSFLSTIEEMGMDDSESLFTAIDLDDSLEISCNSYTNVDMIAYQFRIHHQVFDCF